MRRRVPVRPRRSRTPRRRRVRASAVSLVVDTGPLVALLDADDQDHASCSELLRSWTGVRLVPSPVLVELDHFVPTRALVAFVQGVQRGAFVIEDLQPRDYARVGELLEAYADLELGFVDAAVMAVTERIGGRHVATLDHRHFGVVRLAHTETLDILPSRRFGKPA